MFERLPAMLHELRLPGLAAALEVRLHEAASHQLNHAEFLELALQDCKTSSMRGKSGGSSGA